MQVGKEDPSEGLCVCAHWVLNPPICLCHGLWGHIHMLAFATSHFRDSYSYKWLLRHLSPDIPPPQPPTLVKAGLGRS